MNALEVYMVVAPLVLLLVGGAATYYWLHRGEGPRHRAR
jgi:hypothetical protein